MLIAVQSSFLYAQKEENARPWIKIFGQTVDSSMTISRSQLNQMKSIRPNLPDEFEIRSFIMSSEVNHVRFEFKSNSYKLSEEMTDFLNSKAKISRIKIERVECTMQDNTTRLIGPVVLIVK